MVLICNPAGVVDAKHPGQGLGDIELAGFDQVLLSTEFCCDEQKFKTMCVNVVSRRQSYI